MFTQRFKLFRLFGVQINADLSWLVVVVLAVWWLATGVFPSEGFAPGLDTTTYWLMGIAGAALLFASIVLHELGHAVMANRHQVPIRGITLFIFGGVAEMTEEPPTARAEFLVAVAGPVVSLLLCAAFLGLTGLGSAAGWPAPVTTVAMIVGWLNGILIVFNMVPAFPLDGGRVLRSALWQWKGSLRWATRVTSAIGSGFGVALIGFGVLSAVIGGDLFGGMWLALIGLFVRSAARMSYRQLLLRRALEGEPVSRFMVADPITVQRSMSVRELVDDYVYRHHHKMFPVLDDDSLVGCVTTRDVRELPQDEWGRQTVGSIAKQCSADNSVAPGMDAMQALSKMSSTGITRLLVVDGGELAGILSLKDLLEFFSMKMELERDGDDDGEGISLPRVG